MENTQDSVQLTSAELSNLWTIYLSDSMSICVFAHFLEHIEDGEIKSVISYAKQLSEEHIAYIRTLYEKEEISIAGRH